MHKGLSFQVFIPAFLAISVDLMGYGLVYPLMTELFAGQEGLHMAQGISIGLRHFYLGLSFLLYPLAAFFGSSLMEDLSVRYGQKKILVLCLSGLTVSFVLMGLGVEFLNISLLLIGRALSGLMAGSQPIAQAVIVDTSTPQSKAKNLAILTVVLSSGIVIGPLIGGIFSDTSLTSFFNLSTPFYIAATWACITAVWIFFTFPFKRRQKAQQTSFTSPIYIFYEGLTHKDIRFLTLIFLCMQMGFSLFYQLIQVFVSVVYDFPTWKIGLFNGYLGIAFGFVVLFGIKFFLKYVNVSQLAAFSLLLTGIFLILPMLYPIQLFVWIMSFLAAGCDIMAYGALMACFSQAVGQSNQKWVMHIFASIIAVAWILTGFSTNLIQSVGLRGLIAIGGLFMLLSFLLMCIYMNRHRTLA